MDIVKIIFLLTIKAQDFHPALFMYFYALRFAVKSSIISLCFLFVISYFIIGKIEITQATAVGMDIKKNIPKRYDSNSGAVANI